MRRKAHTKGRSTSRWNRPFVTFFSYIFTFNPVLQKSFEDGLISDHDAWRRMSKARNITSHTYNDGKASEIVEKIYTEYSILLKQLAVRLGYERSEITGLFA